MSDKSWRCFHCDEVFTDEASARDHFAIEGIPPMCVDPLTKDEKARMVVVRKLESELVKWRAENEQLDHEAGCYHAYQTELGTYFGEMSYGGKVKTPHQAFLVYEAMIGAKEAAEYQVAALTASLASVTARAEKAEAFKTWTHDYLDKKGVPATVEDEHLAAGCRIGGRMDLVFASLASMTKELELSEGFLREEREQNTRALDELAELRKRIDGGVKALRDLNGKIVTDMFITDHSYVINNYDAEQALLASPPSPAPVEHEHKFTPYYPGGDWNQCVECGLMKEIPPAPVESNPKSGETK